MGPGEFILTIPWGGGGIFLTHGHSQLCLIIMHQEEEKGTIFCVGGIKSFKKQMPIKIEKSSWKMEDYDSKRLVQKFGRESIIGVERGE